MALAVRDFTITGHSMTRVVLVVSTITLAHVGLVSRLRVFGVSPDLMLLTSLVVALLAGSSMGGAAGFLSGLAFDLFVSTPFGLSALVYGALGFCVGYARDRVLPAARDFPLTLIVCASVAGPLLFTAGLVLFDSRRVPTINELLRIAAIVASWNLCFARPMRFVIRAMLSGGSE